MPNMQPLTTLFDYLCSRLRVLSLLCILSLMGCGNDPTRHQSQQILVIGAGAAGLSAAYALHNNGHQVVVLEARQRVGGRIWSDRRRQNQSVDLGAGWIHGTSNNPVFKLARQHQVKTSATDYENYTVKALAGDSAFTQEDFDSLFDQFDGLNSYSTRRAQATSIRDYIHELLHSNPKLSKAQLNYLATLFIEQEYAAPLEQLSVFALQEGRETHSGGDVMFASGYDQVFAHMVTALDIQLGQIVTAIDYSADQVIITTSQGQQFSADKVLVTVPLGVLKHAAIAFTPALPQNKKAAINQLGMGVFNKVYLGFDEVFWDSQRDFIFHYAVPQTPWVSFVNLYEQYQDKALLAMVTAQSAIDMESKNDEQIVVEIMAQLRAHYGDDIPQPDDIRITRWHRDPFAYGAYSFMPVGASSQARRDLAEPIDNKVFFAGEATSEDYPATVHGAMLSGLREAKRME